MRSLEEFRSGKPGFYPDQSVYAAYACAEFGLAFRDLDGGTGLVFSVSFGDQQPAFRRRTMLVVSAEQRHRLDAGVGQIFRRPDSARRPASPTLGGEYFFLHDRHRAHRPAGHERERRAGVFHEAWAASAFVKPLTGSRGDFAQAVHDEAALMRYLDEVAQYYDAILMQPIVDRDRVSDFSARRRGSLLPRANIRPRFSAMASAPSANC